MYEDAADRHEDDADEQERRYDGARRQDRLPRGQLLLPEARACISGRSSKEFYIFGRKILTVFLLRIDLVRLFSHCR